MRRLIILFAAIVALALLAAGRPSAADSTYFPVLPNCVGPLVGNGPNPSVCGQVPRVTISASSATLTSAQCNVDLNAVFAQTITLPAAASTQCVVTIKDAPAAGVCYAGTYARTILPAGSDLIDGQWSATNGGVGLYSNCASLTLAPTSTGWSIQ